MRDTDRAQGLQGVTPRASTIANASCPEVEYADGVVRHLLPEHGEHMQHPLYCDYNAMAGAMAQRGYYSERKMLNTASADGCHWRLVRQCLAGQKHWQQNVHHLSLRVVSVYMRVISRFGASRSPTTSESPSFGPFLPSPFPLHFFGPNHAVVIKWAIARSAGTI